MNDELSPADLRELELAPVWILSAVGAADGKIDRAERAALQEVIQRCAGHSDSFVRAVFVSVAKNFESVWERYMADERFAVHALEAVADALDRCATPTQALHFKQTLVQLGMDVADASGGVLGIGGKRSGVEKAALTRVAQSLRMSSRRLIAASQSGFSSILVPLDGSSEAEAALSLARSLAAQFGARVTLLEVVPEYRPSAAVAVDGPGVLVPAASAEELHALANAYLASAVSSYGAEGWERVVVDGAPAEAIVGYSREFGADLIVMATSGSAGLKRLFEGKVTEDVVRLSDVPVLLV
ncbi:MAG: universal stress protein, partial [bacterium]